MINCFRTAFKLCCQLQLAPLHPGAQSLTANGVTVENEAEFALFILYHKGGHGLQQDLVVARKLLIRQALTLYFPFIFPSYFTYFPILVGGKRLRV